MVRALPTLHDLPPLWDGHRVEWKGWETYWTTADWHMKPVTCNECGSRDKSAMNTGLVYPLAGETVTMTRLKRSKNQPGRTYEVTQEIPATPTYWLHVWRCPSCHLDTVWDRRDDTWWDLDESDYGVEGSTDGALPGL